MKATQLTNKFWNKVQKTNKCWNWTGSQYKDGYGAYGVYINGIARTRRTHRLSYEYLVGLIPDGLVIDHLCKNRLCVNPKHLEPVTIQENTLRGNGIPAINSRKKYCNNGHKYDDANTYRWNRTRRCKACNTITARRYRKNKRLKENNK